MISMCALYRITKGIYHFVANGVRYIIAKHDYNRSTFDLVIVIFNTVHIISETDYTYPLQSEISN